MANPRRSNREELPSVVAGRGDLMVAVAPRNRPQQTVVDLWPRSRILFLLGPAGTGKSHIALALAVAELLKMKPSQNPHLMLSRPTVSVDDDLGFFPGTLEEKLGPWSAAFHDVYGQITFSKWEQLQSSVRVELVAAGMLRGRTVRNGVLLIDECQNLTKKQLVCALTRVGPNSRLVLSGDPEQSDRYSAKSSPMVEAARLLDTLDTVSTVRFSKADQLRDPLVGSVLDRLGKW